MDNCPGQPNPQQTDRDADGAGDACDLCPLDPLDDAERDGICAELDSCPLLHNSGQSNQTRVTSVQLRGAVSQWMLSPDSRTLVYQADAEVDDEFRLYATTLASGATVDLGPVPEYPRVQLRISPDSVWVVYLTQTFGAEPGDELYAVPLAGGEPVRLDDRAVHSGPVADYLISPDGSAVVYRARTDSAMELFSVAIGGGTPVKLNAPLVANGNVEHSNDEEGTDIPPYQISPDGDTVVYHADQAVDHRYELYAVPIGGGTAIRLNGDLAPSRSVLSLQDVNLRATFITSGGTVLYLAEGDLARVDLYRVPIGGGSPVKLNLALDVIRYAVTPAQTAAIYSTATTLDRVALAGGTPVQLVTGGASVLLISPDGERVVYIATYPNYGLWSVPTNGGAAPIWVDSRPPYQDMFAISPDSASIVYRTYPGTTLNAVAVEGGPVVVLNESEESLTGHYEISGDGADVIYGTRAPQAIRRVPIGGGSAERLDDPVTVSGNYGFQMSPDRSFITYVGQTVGALDVYAVPVQADPDGDGIPGQCDNCPGANNLDQADEDADGRGGSCDNCRFAGNIEQQDADLDGAGDACDCAPGNPAARPPDEVLDVLAAKPAPNVVRLSWAAAAGADVYSVSRVRLALLGPDQFGPCFEPARTETWIDDATTTQPGVGFGYMIEGVDTVCGPGTLGLASDGTERTNLNPAACP
jgi:Tol biopolymer transport system component